MGGFESKQDNVIEELRQQVSQLICATDKQKEIQELHRSKN